MKKKYGRILTVQDISCIGQCSLTVALPIISACGHETIILPSAILSSHTYRFKGWTFIDLTEDLPAIIEHWKSEGITFDACYTGYLGSKKQIDIIKRIFSDMLRPNGIKLVDPAMADDGLLYPGFDDEYVAEMKKLIAVSDIALPNITECCFLTGTEYKTEYDEKYVKDMVSELKAIGAKAVVVTGVKFNGEATGVFVSDKDGNEYYYGHKVIPGTFHGTGDIYASAFIGAYVKGLSINESARLAADYTVKCIENSIGDEDHWYGVKFETALRYLTDKLN